MNTLISHYLKKLGYTNASLLPINESTNNAVFSYEEHIIKVSTDKHNLKTEYEILSQLANKGKFPLAEQYGTVEGHFVLILQRLP
jgi:hypothetical protein